MTEKEFKQVVEYVQYALRIQNERMTGERAEQNILEILTNIENLSTTLTEEGFRIYAKKKAKKEKEQFVEDPVFRKFYDNYPVSNKFTYNGMEFIPVAKRGLRDEFQKSQNKFQFLCSSKDYSPESVVEALKKDVSARLEKSFKTGQNQLDHMPGMLVWLNKEKFYTTYLDEAETKEQVSVKTKTEDDTDIF